jgi:hypothetical protein
VTDNEFYTTFPVHGPDGAKIGEVVVQINGVKPGQNCVMISGWESEELAEAIAKLRQSEASTEVSRYLPLWRRIKALFAWREASPATPLDAP